MQEQSAKPGIVKLPKKGIKNMIAVVSGKGGVGKSTVTALLACELRRLGFSVGILDGDIGGASIARLFGLTRENLEGYFATSSNGIKILSFSLLAKDRERATIWRGALVANAIRQLYSRLDFGDLDYLLIDSPPGTSDMPLTLYQFFPLDGIVTVTAPHSIVREVVSRSLQMAKRLGVPVLGIIENFSYLKCSNCQKRHLIFGKTKTAERNSAKLLAELPMDERLAELEDAGNIQDYESPEIRKAVNSMLGKN